MLIEPSRTNTLRLMLFDYDDSVYDDDPDFLGQIMLTGVGAGMLPLEEQDFQVQKKEGPRKVMHMANRTVYEDDTVSGTLSLQYAPVAKLQTQKRDKGRQKERAAQDRQLKGRAGRRARAERQAQVCTLALLTTTCSPGISLTDSSCFQEGTLPPVKEAASAGRPAAANALAGLMASRPGSVSPTKRPGSESPTKRPSFSRSSTSSVLTTAGQGMGVCALDHVSATLDLSFRQIGSLHPMPSYARRGRNLDDAAHEILPAYTHWEDDGLAIPHGPTSGKHARNLHHSLICRGVTDRLLVL